MDLEEIRRTIDESVAASLAEFNRNIQGTNDETDRILQFTPEEVQEIQRFQQARQIKTNQVEITFIA